MEKVRLRKINNSDIKYFAIWWRDEELAKLTSGILDAISDDELEQYFDCVLNARGDYHFMIVVNNITIGHISLSKREDDWYETQIVIGNKDYLGKGYGHKAIGLLIKEAKRSNIYKIYLEVRPTNIRAIRAYIKSGFVEVGIIKYPENRYLPETLRMEYKK